MTLGVQLLGQRRRRPRRAASRVRYRAVGDDRSGATRLPLFRVRPEASSAAPCREQFAGSIFELTPGHDLRDRAARDRCRRAGRPDGHADGAATTRPPTGRARRSERAPIATRPALAAALDAAAARRRDHARRRHLRRHLLITASGTAANPIVIRGASTDGTILDGGGCDACNVLEVYGSFVHVERLTLAHAAARAALPGRRAPRATSSGACASRDVRLGIGSHADQRDFYLCDNVARGPARLAARSTPTTAAPTPTTTASVVDGERARRLPQPTRRLRRRA